MLLRRAWNGWKRIAHRIADFQVRVLLTVFYYTLLAPFALGVKLRNPLGSLHNQGWLPVPERARPEEEHAREQS